MTTNETFLAAAQALQRSGTAYALVSVIRAQAPASARAGDKAVVTADGQVHGWIGGGCAQPIVVRTVRAALADGQARLVRIAPAPESPADTPVAAEVGESPARAEPAPVPEHPLSDVLEFGMSCHSGGVLELFVDPILPRARLVVIGASPVALALARLAPQVGFAVTLVAPGLDPALLPDGAALEIDDDPARGAARVAPGAWVVVATQGRRDVQGLRLALALRARQVSFVASARKAQVLKDSLVAAGADAAAVAAIVAPAGAPIGAATPEEIALSVLAAVVASRRGGAQAALAEAPASEAPVPEVPAGAGPAPTHSCCGG